MSIVLLRSGCAAVLGLALAACGDNAVGPPPDAAPAPPDATPDATPALPDADLDGVADDDDCDDGNPDLHHTYAYQFRDRDGDQRYIAEAGTVCAGATLPAGHRIDAPADELDCDDTSPASWRTVDGWADGDGDGVGIAPASPLCIGAALPDGWAAAGEDCAAGDAGRWQLLSYSHRDGDGDGAWIADAGQLCVGAALPVGYRSGDPGGAPDCAPADADRWLARTLYPDGDGDGVGVEPSAIVCVGATVPTGFAPSAGDCADDDDGAWRWLSYAYRDADLDGTTILAAGAICAGAALPPGYRTTPSGDDCDDADRDRWRTVALYGDTDGDGVGAGAVTATCLGATLPPATSLAGDDCAATDPTRWRFLPYRFVDLDGDHATVASAGAACSGAALLPPFFATASGADCDDVDPARTRFAVIYPDLDGDGVGAAPREIACLGADLPPGRRIAGYDDDDGDPLVIVDEDSEDEELDLILGD